ncbi:MAG: DsbC family protein [Deltaproteobacteria bacterium]|nr:DsbC family protein [Deltaproteobacteria bacterium]
MKRFSYVAAFMLFAAGILLSSAGFVHAFGPGVGSKCGDCHTLAKDEAAKLLMVEKFKAEVSEVREGPIKGIWEVDLTQGDKKIRVYVDYGKKFLIEGAVNFSEISKLGEIAEQQKPKQQYVDLKLISLKDAVVIGDAKAANKVIVFSDPDCPYCRQLDKEIKKIQDARKDVVFYIKLLPLPMHPNAHAKSMSILCNGKKPQLLDDAMADKALPKGECKTSELDDNTKLAGDIGIHGTPGIILPDGRLIPGYIPSETLLSLIDNPQPQPKP